MFTATIEGLDELARDWADACRALSDGARKGVQAGIEEGAAQARASHPYKDGSGDLTKSIKGRVETSTQGGAVGVIEATALHASFVEEGTDAHDIRPKAASGFKGPTRKGQSRRGVKDIGTTRVALRWTEGGQVHFAQLVHHPGTPSLPFIGPAVLKAERVVLREIEIAEAEAARIMER